ncbi:hypothetical protein Scep_030524 [Stephania cephalantha]|uniref:Uncharacterized protein n=1 Tax=Stephania cephalantha TaxID=152367 RepID=A0AAP0E7K3_9MAGN
MRVNRELQPHNSRETIKNRTHDLPQSKLNRSSLPLSTTPLGANIYILNNLTINYHIISLIIQLYVVEITSFKN